MKPLIAKNFQFPVYVLSTKKKKNTDNSKREGQKEFINCKEESQFLSICVPCVCLIHLCPLWMTAESLCVCVKREGRKRKKMNEREKKRQEGREKRKGGKETIRHLQIRYLWANHQASCLTICDEPKSWAKKSLDHSLRNKIKKFQNPFEMLIPTNRKEAGFGKCSRKDKVQSCF